MKHLVHRWLHFGRRLCLGWLLLLVAGSTSWAATYLNHAELSARLKRLTNDHPQRVVLESMALSRQQREVWRLELGIGPETERSRRPALLVVAGLEGHDLAGTVMTLAWTEQILAGAVTNDAVRRLLETTTLYVVPRLNADAAEAFFGQPKTEQATNDSPFDEDHDGLVDEDGPDDFNGDGLITSMRVEDPEGDYILDPEEPRLMAKADRSKGERGVWRLLPEGKDDDHDEAWNEDGPGGVNFNRNFPFGYRFFEATAGRHAVSVSETRALADFVVAHPSIGAAFVFGTPDNLTQPPKAEPGGKRPPTAFNEEDLPILRELGRRWRDALGLKKEVPGSTEPGAFHDWIYFHRGRLALAARPWSPSIQLELDRSKAKPDPASPGKEGRPEEKAANEETKPPAAEEQPTPAQAPGDSSGARPRRAASRPAAVKPGAETRNEDERAWLKWLDTNAPAAFVPWKPIDHPDFPGKKVEIGGFAPFARLLPPEELLDDLARAAGGFLTDLAGRLPHVGFRKVEARHLGDAVYELLIQVDNRGYLPTALAQGKLTDEVHPTRLLINLEDQAFLSGARRTMLDPIPGSGGMIETRVTVRAKGLKEIPVEVISMLGGTAQTTIQLPEAK